MTPEGKNFQEKFDPLKQAGVFDHMRNNLEMGQDVREALTKSGSKDLVEESNAKLAKIYALPADIIEDLKTLTLGEIKEKYKLEGSRVDTDFLINGLVDFVAKRKEDHSK